MHRSFKAFVLALAFSVAAASGPAALAQTGQTDQNQAKPAPSPIAVLLEKTGLSYTKLSEGVWEIAARGKNLSEFTVRVAAADDTLVVLAKIADRSSLALKDALLIKMLELNDHFDTLKIALDENMLYARIDIHTRLADDQELKYMIEQMAKAVDETYPHVKPYLK